MTKLTSQVNKFLLEMESSSSKNPGEIKLTQPELQVAKVSEDLNKLKYKISALFAMAEGLDEADNFIKGELVYEIRSLNISLEAILKNMNIKMKEAAKKYEALIDEAYIELEETQLENKEYEEYLNAFPSGFE